MGKIPKQVSRRNILKTTGGLAGSALLAGCTGGDSGDGGDGSGGTKKKTTAQKTSGLETFTNEAGVEVGATWEAVEKLAKEEGEFTLYSPNDRGDLVKWMKGFDDLYPDIKLNHITGSSSDLLPRWLTEYKADNVHADTYSGSTGLDVLARRGQVMELSSEYLPAYGETPDKFKNEHLIGVRLKVGAIVFNSNEVEQSAVTSWDDVLTDERWSGGNLGWDPSPNVFIMTALMKMEGPEAFEKLRQQEPHWTDSHTDLARFCAAGQYPIALTYGNKPGELPELPLGVFDIPKPGGIAGSVINNKAPHPNAALVFTDYLASDKGQKYIAKTHFSLLYGYKPMPDSKNWEINPAFPGDGTEKFREVWAETMGSQSAY